MVKLLLKPIKNIQNINMHYKLFISGRKSFLAPGRIMALILTAALLLAIEVPLLGSSTLAAAAELLPALVALLPASGAELSAALLVACFLMLGCARAADGSLPRRAVVALVASILVNVQIPLLGASAATATAGLLADMQGLLPRSAFEVGAAVLLAGLFVCISPLARRTPGCRVRRKSFF